MEISLEELLLDVQTAPSQLEKAKAEQRFIEAIPNLLWRGKIYKLTDMSGDSYSNIKYRHRLIKASPLSDGFWSLIESGKLTLASAVIELRALEINSGVVKRGRKPKGNIESESVVPKPKKIYKFPVTSQIVSLIEKVKKGLTKQNKGLSEDEINLLIKELKYDIENLIRIVKIRADRKESLNGFIAEEFSQKEIKNVNKSCDLLNTDRPKKGRPVNLKKAKASMRAKVFKHHPDHNLDDEQEAAARTRELVEAYEILKDYNDNLVRSNS